MSIFDYPKWTLSEALTCFDVGNKQAMGRLKEVLEQSDANYLESVREYYARRRIRPSIEEDRIMANHLVMHPFRAMLNRLLIQHQQMQTIYMTITREQAEKLKLREWKEITWDLAEKPNDI